MSASAVAVSLVCVHGQHSRECAHFSCKGAYKRALAAVMTNIVATGAIFNLPAALIIAAMSVNLLHRYAGDRGSQHRDGALKVSIIVLFIIAGLSYIDT